MLGLDVIFARRYMNVEFDVWFSMLGFFDAPYVETFYVKFSMYDTSKILRMSLSVIEAYDQNFTGQYLQLWKYRAILKII